MSEISDISNLSNMSDTVSDVDYFRISIHISRSTLYHNAQNL